jgi:hypothetical protein
MFESIWSPSNFRFRTLGSDPASLNPIRRLIYLGMISSENRHPLFRIMLSHPSNASADPLLARDSRVSSGFGNGLPESRKRLVMG